MTSSCHSDVPKRKVSLRVFNQAELLSRQSGVPKNVRLEATDQSTSLWPQSSPRRTGNIQSWEMSFVAGTTSGTLLHQQPAKASAAASSLCFFFLFCQQYEQQSRATDRQRHHETADRQAVTTAGDQATTAAGCQPQQQQQLVRTSTRCRRGLRHAKKKKCMWNRGWGGWLEGEGEALRLMTVAIKWREAEPCHAHTALRSWGHAFLDGQQSVQHVRLVITGNRKKKGASFPSQFLFWNVNSPLSHLWPSFYVIPLPPPQPSQASLHCYTERIKSGTLGQTGSRNGTNVQQLWKEVSGKETISKYLRSTRWEGRLRHGFNKLTLKETSSRITFLSDVASLCCVIAIFFIIWQKNTFELKKGTSCTYFICVVLRCCYCRFIQTF